MKIKSEIPPKREIADIASVFSMVALSFTEITFFLIVSMEELSLSVNRHEVHYDEDLIDLTAREFTLLQTLLENKNIVLSRSSLLERVWGYDYMGETNVVDVYIRYLRSKIDDVYGVHIIQTVRGVGYVIKE